MSRKTKKGLSKEVKELFVLSHKGNFPQLVKKLSQVNEPNLIEDFGGNSLLHIAAKAGNLSVVSYFLANHFPTSKKNKEGKLPRDCSKDKAMTNLFSAYESGMKKLKSTPSVPSKSPNEGPSVGWKSIKSKRERIIKDISVSEFERSITKVRNNFTKVGDIRQDVVSNYFAGNPFGQELKAQESAFSESLKISSGISKKINNAKSTYAKYKGECIGLVQQMKKDISEMEEFLGRMETEFEEKKDRLEDNLKFVQYVIILLQEKMSQIKRGKEVAAIYERTNKKYLDQNKKFQRSRLQLQMKELSGKKTEDKLQREGKKISTLESTIVSTRRKIEEYRAKVFSIPDVCFWERKKISDIHLQNEAFKGIKEMFTELSVCDEIYIPLIRNNLLSERTLEDYEDLTRFSKYESQFMIGYLKGEKEYSKKLLKVLSPDNFEIQDFVNEFVKMINMRNKSHGLKYLFNFSEVFFYRSSETKEQKICLQFPYLEYTIYHWVKKCYDPKKKYEDIMQMERGRTKTEIKKMFKKLCALLVGIKKSKLQLKELLISPVTVRVGANGDFGVVDYTIRAGERTVLTEMFTPKREKFKVSGTKYNQKNGFKAAAVLFYEMLAEPNDCEHFPESPESVPSYFTQSEKSLLGKLLSDGAEKNLLGHPYWSEDDTEKGERLELKRFQKENYKKPTFEYTVTLSTKKNAPVAAQILPILLQMKTLDDLCGIFKGKNGIDGFGNLSPYVIESFWRHCEKLGFFDGKIGSFLPTDERELTKEFTAIGRFLLKLLLEKRSELHPVFTPYVVSYIIGEDPSESHWELYCKLFDKKYVYSLKNLLHDDKIHDMKILFKLGEVVNKGNRRRFLKMKYKKKLKGKKHRMSNLIALRKGFRFTLSKEVIKSLKVKELTQFFCASKK